MAMKDYNFDDSGQRQNRNYETGGFEVSRRKCERMESVPQILEVKTASLRQALAAESLAVFDFETSDVRPREAIVAGLGVYLPEQHRCFYLNIGHQVPDDRHPRISEADAAAAVGEFLGDPLKHAVMHNATYDLRMMFKMGITIDCRVSCSLIHTHRTDENLREYGDEATHHYWLDRVTYGLKELTVVLFNERPPSLHDVIGRTNTILAPVHDVAVYCAQDVVNTYNLYERNRADHQSGSWVATTDRRDRRPQQHGPGEDDVGGHRS